MREHKRIFSIAVVGVALLAGITVSASCSRRPHTSSTFGVANRTFFDRQAQAANNGSAQGLDSEEASAIHQHYRQGLGNRGQTTADPKSSVMILQEDKRDAPKRP